MTIYNFYMKNVIFIPPTSNVRLYSSPSFCIHYTWIQTKFRVSELSSSFSHCSAVWVLPSTVYILYISLSRTLYHQVLTFGTMKFSSMSYPLYPLALCHMPTCCCGFHQVICVGLSALCLTVVHWGCYKIITIMFSANRSCLLH